MTPTLPEPQFGPLPPVRRRNTKISRAIEKLKERPGEPALVVQNAKSSSVAAAWKVHGCCAVTRVNDQGTVDIWAWWPAKK